MPHFYDQLKKSIDAALQASQDLAAERQELLGGFADQISQSRSKNGIARVNFICTHNSRRSHLSHLWAHTAAAHFGLDDVATYSGGTEATECNPRTISAFERAGFRIETASEPPNPHYRLFLGQEIAPVEVFSKVYHDVSTGNPNTEYIAGMCCDDVDQKCPVVIGAVARIPLHYRDPKASDGSPEESQTYDERCRQIAAEMFFLMSKVQEN